MLFKHVSSWQRLFWTMAALVVAIAVTAFGGLAGSQARLVPIFGWIEISPAGEGKINVTGHAFATQPSEGEFSLSLIRTSQGNSAKSGQNGQFKVGAGGAVKLSSTAINIAPGDRLKIELFLRSGGAVIFKAVSESAVED